MGIFTQAWALASYLKLVL